jgi:hypothetical protein
LYVKNIDADFRSLYDVKDAKQLSFYQDAIALDTILKAEDRSLEEVGYTDTLIYYRRFFEIEFFIQTIRIMCHQHWCQEKKNKQCRR